MRACADPSSATKPKSLTKQTAAALVARLATLQQEANAIEANRDAAILRLSEKVQPRLDAIATEIADGTDLLGYWARANRKEFGESQSLGLPAGTLQFRWTARSVELLDGWDWSKVLAKLKGRWKRFVREKPEVDKREILKATDPNLPARERLPDAQLRKLGLKIARQEEFSLELRPETVPQAA